MKIYDCFTFYNELDLLELRLRETYDEVDVFVIAEATRTFQGREKPLYLKDNWDRFSLWHDKIRRIEITDLAESGDPWANEAASREHLKAGLHDAEDLDLVVLSDVDEILRPATLRAMRTGNRAVYGTRMPLFYFRLNYLQTHPTQWWAGASAVRFKLLNDMEQLRRMRNQIGIAENTVIMHAGWHFGWLGDDVRAREKIESFAHSELNKSEVLDNINLELSIKNGRGLNPYGTDSDDKHVVVEVDDYFPRTILVDKERWSKYIIPDATEKVTDLLRFGTVPQ
jgi:Glycosyltransferase family 17